MASYDNVCFGELGFWRVVEFVTWPYREVFSPRSARGAPNCVEDRHRPGFASARSASAERKRRRLRCWCGAFAGRGRAMNVRLRLVAQHLADGVAHETVSGVAQAVQVVRIRVEEHAARREADGEQAVDGLAILVEHAALGVHQQAACRAQTVGELLRSE